MNKFSALCIGFFLPVLLFFSSSDIADAQEFRTFTNREGNKIEATLIEVVGKEAIRIKRKSDGREFVLKIATLSLDDQQYLVEEMNKKAGFAPGGVGKGTLIINLPHILGRVAAHTSRFSSTDSKLSVQKYRFAAPVGTWMAYNPYAISGEYLIPYRGEKNWDLEVSPDDQLVWLSRDGGEKELVGISLPYSNSEEGSDNRKRIRAIDETKVKHVLNVSLMDIDDWELTRTLSDEVPLAVSTYANIKSETIRDLARKNILALSADIDFETIPDLADLAKLKCLTINVEGISSRDVIAFPPLPELEHFTILDKASQVDWEKTLAGFPKLQSLTTRQMRRESENTGTAIRTFESNPDLVWLVLQSRNIEYFSPSVLRTCPKLQKLSLDGSIRIETANDFGALSSLKNLRYLLIENPDVDSNDLDRWFESGDLAGLTDFAGPYLPPIQHCPKLEALTCFGSSSTSRENLDFERIANAPPTLEFLNLSSLSNKDFEVAKLPNPESLQSLQVYSSQIDDAELLYRFPNLTYLRFINNGGRLANIDLGRFPKLRYLYLSSNDDLEGLQGLSSHSELKYCYLSRLRYLSDLGEPAPNTTLEALYLYGLRKLKNLDSLSGVTGCKRLTISDCDEIGAYDEFEGNNNLEYLSIRDCEYLTDTSRIPRPN